MAENEEQKPEEELEVKEEVEAPETPPAEEPEREPEDLVPATVVSTVRARARAAELEVARLRGENDALKATATPPEKSPLELAAEEQEVSIDEVVVSGKLLREQQAFTEQQAATKAQNVTHTSQKSDYEDGLLAVPQDELNALVSVGGHLLTEGDQRNAWDAGKNSGKELIRILKHRISDAGLQPKVKPKAEGKPKTEKKKKEDEEEAPEMAEVFDAQTERAFEACSPK